MAQAPAGARCAQHPETAAVDVCQRCGAFVCAECTEIRDEDVYCTKCIPQLDKPTSVRIKVLFWTALLWMPAGFVIGQLRVPLASAAWGLATPLEAALLVVFWFLERGARKRGEVGTKGRGYFIGTPIVLGLQWLLILLSLGYFVFAFRH